MLIGICGLDVGASQRIIDGKIKIKNGTQIERYTKTGIRFTDGSEIDADVVMYATGCVTTVLSPYVCDHFS